MDASPVSTIVNCPCGAKVRLPATTESRSFACPRCKGIFATTADARVIVARPIAAGETQTCPICQSAINPGENAIACPTCSQMHHQECWIEIGGCSTYGCVQAPPEAKESAAPQPLSAWGDTKICPVCGETIKSIALKCRYCQTEFHVVDPLTMGDLHRKDKNLEAQKKLQTTVSILFGFCVIAGCLAPIMLPISLIYVLPRKKELQAAGPLYLILGYSSIALTAVYSIMMLLLYLAGQE